MGAFRWRVQYPWLTKEEIAMHTATGIHQQRETARQCPEEMNQLIVRGEVQRLMGPASIIKVNPETWHDKDLVTIPTFVQPLLAGGMAQPDTVIGVVGAGESHQARHSSRALLHGK